MKIGTSELLLIIFVALLVFGPSKLPEFGKFFGETVAVTKKYIKKLTDEVEEEVGKPVEEAIAPLNDLAKPLEPVTEPIKEFKKAIDDSLKMK